MQKIVITIDTVDTAWAVVDFGVFIQNDSKTYVKRNTVVRIAKVANNGGVRINFLDGAEYILQPSYVETVDGVTITDADSLITELYKIARG